MSPTVLMDLKCNELRVKINFESDKTFQALNTISMNNVGVVKCVFKQRVFIFLEKVMAAVFIVLSVIKVIVHYLCVELMFDCK